MDILISVIIPVYNVERYLEKCISSIVAQSYKMLEIILIDDGSTDDSGIICDEYAQKDNRIKVFHQQNGGVSAARNHGFTASSGEFIYFIDGDDYLEKRMLEKMIHISNGADIVICNLYEEYVSRKELFYKGCLIQNFNGADAIKEIFTVNEKPVFLGHLGNKMFRREVVQDLRFNSKYSIYEDLLFVINAFFHASNIRFISFAGYHYVQRSKSAMYSKFSEKTYSAVECASEIFTMVKMYFPELTEDAQHFYLTANLKQATLCLISKAPAKYLELIRSNLIAERPYVQSFSRFSAKDKIYYKLICLDTRIFTLFYKMFVMSRRRKYEKKIGSELYSG